MGKEPVFTLLFTIDKYFSKMPVTCNYTLSLGKVEQNNGSTHTIALISLLIRANTPFLKVDYIFIKKL